MLNEINDPVVIKLLHKNKLLFQLIKSELINSKIKDIVVDNNKVKDEIKKIFDKEKISNEEELKIWLNKNNIDNQDLTNQVSKALKLKIYCDENFSKKIESKFLEIKYSLDKVIYSLIRVKDHFKANELFLRLNEKEATFDDLARIYSEGNEKYTKGIVGPVSLSNVHPKLRELLLTAKPGKVCKPINIEGMSLIVKIEFLNNATLNDQNRELIIRELFESSINEESRIIMKEFISKIS